MLPKALSHSHLPLSSFPFRSPLPTSAWSLVVLSVTSFACTTSGLWGHRSGCSVTGLEHVSHRHGGGACIGEWQQGGPPDCGFSSSHTHFFHPSHGGVGTGATVPSYLFTSFSVSAAFPLTSSLLHLASPRSLFWALSYTRQIAFCPFGHLPPPPALNSRGKRANRSPEHHIKD